MRAEPLPKTIRIFISSPGDVKEERELARGLIEQLRRRYVRQFDLHAIYWEDMPLDANASFQEGIDAVLNRVGVDIAVFVLWARFGSPVRGTMLKQDGTPYDSGTEREFALMTEAQIKSAS